MPRQSAGILLYRQREGTLEVFLVHPGGPFWAKKDAGAWSIPKGEFSPDGDDALTAARREFYEETGHEIEGEFRPLAPLKQSSAKIVHAWAVRGDLDPRTIRSNTFAIEWPPRSGKQQSFPEVDRGEWFALHEARVKILKGQTPFLDELENSLV
jgi:predicted NUDIX family NTP pyrophosphohydrolase